MSERRMQVLDTSARSNSALDATFQPTDRPRVREGKQAERVLGSGLALLALLWIVHSLANYVWLRTDTRPPYYDVAGHALVSLRVADLPYTTDLLAAARGFLTASDYPPLVYAVAVPFVKFFGRSADVLTSTNALFLAIILLATFGIGRKLGNTGIGLLAATIVSLYPMIYGLAREYLLEIPLVAMVALSLWLLLRTDDFEHPVTSLAWGLSLALGLWTKWTFAIFVVGPFVVTFLHSAKSWRKSKLLNLAMALGIGLLVGSFWYLYNLRRAVAILQMQSTWGRTVGEPGLFSADSWLYYLRVLVSYQVLVPFALVFCGAIIALLWKRAMRPAAAWLLAWIVVPYVAFCIFGNKDPRYTLPYLPAMAIVTALGLGLVRPRALQYGLTGLLLGWAVFEFIGLTWGLSQRLPNGMLPSRIEFAIAGSPARLYSEVIHIASPASAEDWKNQTILHDIMKHMAEDGEQHAMLMLLSEAPFFEPNAFMFFAWSEEMPIGVGHVTGLLPVADARARLLASDYVVTKTGSLGPAWAIQEAGKMAREIGDPTSELGQRFELLRTYSLPDRTQAALYKLRK